MRLILWLVTNVLALAAAAGLLSGIAVAGPGADLGEQLGSLVVVAAVLGVLTSFVKPVLKLLSLPFILLTLGLFLLVINAVLLLIASAIAGTVGVGFEVSGFGSAVLGSIVITVVTWLLDGVLGAER